MEPGVPLDEVKAPTHEFFERAKARLNREVTPALRDALAARKVENVMLVSSFLAAAALAQVVGTSVGYAQTGLLFVEPDTATLAVVNSSDGSITDVHRQPLTPGADSVAELATLLSSADSLDARPDVYKIAASGLASSRGRRGRQRAPLLQRPFPPHARRPLARALTPRRIIRGFPFQIKGLGHANLRLPLQHLRAREGCAAEDVRPAPDRVSVVRSVDLRQAGDGRRQQ